MNEPRPPLGQGNPQQAGLQRPIGAAPASPQLRSPQIGLQPKPAQPVRAQGAGDDPIELVEELGAPAATQQTARAADAAPVSKIRFGPELGHKKHDWKRATHVGGTGACRVKSFHGKYSDQGLEYMDDQINEWLDAHPDIEVKFVTSTVGVFEGKIREPALVLNLWY